MDKLSTVYIVGPTHKLASMDFPSTSLRDFVIAERVWLNSEGGVSDFTDDDHLSIAKISVLAYFLSFKDLDQLLEFPRLTTGTFDQYWVIRRFDPDGKLSHLADYARRVDESRFETLGNLLADEVVKRLVGWTRCTSST